MARNKNPLLIAEVVYDEKFNPTEWADLYGENLGPYAQRNFKGFVSILYHLIKEENREYDLITGGGDSGMAMIKLAELVYKRLDLTIPPILRVPFRRYKDDKTEWSDKTEDFFDNNILLPQIEEELK